MKGPQVKAMREAAGLTVTAAAAAVKVSARTWQRWEASNADIPEAKSTLIELVIPNRKTRGRSHHAKAR